MAADISIVRPEERYRQEWRRLYDGYATFYRRPMTDEIAATVWGWLQDPAHEIEGVLAVHEGRPLGLAHYRRMPSPLRGADIGFLDDLFVDPAARGARIGDALIAHVRGVARERGWSVVRWLTADDNYRARALYDRVAKKTAWNVYELTP
ncbi:MAG TPA: GNAT family N-acetyltransferase [Geminicoccaceae bacterium]